MIKNKKGEDFLVTMFILALAIVIVVVILTSKTDLVKNRTVSEINISKYLPEKLEFKHNPSEIPKELKDYTFKFAEDILSEHEDTHPEIPGEFYLIKRDILENPAYTIGFRRINRNAHLFTREGTGILSPDSMEILQDSKPTYYEADMFTSTDLKIINELLEGKMFFVIAQSDDRDDYSALAFFHHILRLPIESEDVQKEIDISVVLELENLFKTNMVLDVAFETEESTNIIFLTRDGKLISKEVASKKNPYILMYKYKDYIVFFPKDRGRKNVKIVEEDDNLMLKGSGYVNSDLYKQMEEHNLATIIE